MEARDRATQEQLPRATKDKREREHVYEISGLGHPQIYFALSSYLELVDWTGRIVRQDKRGIILKEIPPILEG